MVYANQKLSCGELYLGSSKLTFIVLLETSTSRAELDFSNYRREVSLVARTTGTPHTWLHCLIVVHFRLIKFIH